KTTACRMDICDPGNARFPQRPGRSRLFLAQCRAGRLLRVPPAAVRRDSRMAYSQRWGEQRWPEVPRDRDADPPARAGRRRPEPQQEPEDLDYPDDSPFDTDRPIVNPYAVVALVAALVLLFPVARVLGLSAFTHPRGRFMAFAAFLLGAFEAAWLVAFVVLPDNRVSDIYARVGDALGVSAGSEAAAGG